ncbi:MAG: type II toxin-antitoxin system PemK/MazF family toxin [Jiangellaceae bacterium]
MRGDVHRLRAPRGTRGHEQRGPRHGVVVQSDWMQLSTLLIAPTSASAPPRPFRPVIELGGTATRVLIEQIVAVDPSRLGDFAGRLSPFEMAEVDRALAEVFGLVS